MSEAIRFKSRERCPACVLQGNFNSLLDVNATIPRCSVGHFFEDQSMLFAARKQAASAKPEMFPQAVKGEPSPPGDIVLNSQNKIEIEKWLGVEVSDLASLKGGILALSEQVKSLEMQVASGKGSTQSKGLEYNEFVVKVPEYAMSFFTESANSKRTRMDDEIQQQFTYFVDSLCSSPMGS